MKYKLIKDNKFLPTEGYAGITIYPFIFVDTNVYKWKNEFERDFLLNHEKIHLKQQKELLLIPFYLIYGIEYFIRYLMYKDKKKAYRNISFEREAYDNEKNFSYLKSRSSFSWIKYITK